MKAKICLLFLLIYSFTLSAQTCTINNSSGCVCKDGSNDCDLLPNIKVSRDLLLDQNANFESPGRYELSVSTPNVGHGPLRVNVTDFYICGPDTIQSSTPITSCQNGHTPKQLVVQTIYHKEPNGTMTSIDRFAGSMTYHPNHGHMHFDDWGIFTIREEDPTEPDPLKWPIIGDGAKIGFCLMDYGSCSDYNGHCRDDNDNILTTNAPNFGLGGGSYTCGLYDQGISSGYTDIYDYSLDGMHVNIPPGVCNGNYKLVVHVDPHNLLVEENDADNIEVIDITLTQQSTSNTGVIPIDYGSNLICNGNPVTLTLPSIGGTYLWSNGASSNTITVNTPGSYSCEITTNCGTVYSDTINVLQVNTTIPVINTPNPICSGENVTLNSSINVGTVNWYDNINAQTPVHTGMSFTTPNLFWGTTYYAENIIAGSPQLIFAEPTDHTGNSDYSSNSHNGEIWFRANEDITLKSVKVYTDTPGERIIELQTLNGTVVLDKVIYIPVGTSRISLNFDIAPGDWMLTTNEVKNNQVFGHNSPRFQRTSGFSSYPITINNALSIDNSNAGSSYYYYFYDWEVEIQPTPCLSTRSQVVVNVVQSKDPTFSYADSSFCEKQFGITPDFVSTSGGQFSANNNLVINAATGQIDASTFLVANSPYTIYYELGVSNCITMDSFLLEAKICSSNETLNRAGAVKLFPNPSDGQFTLGLPDSFEEAYSIELFDISGKMLDTKSFPSGNNTHSFNYQHLEGGVYFLRLSSKNELVTKKILIAK